MTNEATPTRQPRHDVMHRTHPLSTERPSGWSGQVSWQLLVGFAAGLVISVATAPVGISGAVFLLPVQLDLLTRRLVAGTVPGVIRCGLMSRRVLAGRA
jgi:hypothetical protein